METSKVDTTLKIMKCSLNVIKQAGDFPNDFKIDGKPKLLSCNVEFANNDCVITIIGQLNVYTWFFARKIYDFCLTNYNIIQTELLSNKNIKKRQKSFNKKKSVCSKKQISYIKIECISDDSDIVVLFE